MSALSDFDAKLVIVIQDKAAMLSAPERQAFLLEAVSRYSQDRPLVAAAQIAGDGGFDYDLPDDWEEGFSDVRQVEYPAGQQQPEIPDDNDWLLYQTKDGKVLRFLAFSPSATETILLTYTVRHQASGDGTTVPAADQDAVVNLAGALCCYALSRKYAQTSEPSIQADAVNYGSKSGDYAKRGKELEGLYKTHIAPAAAEGGLPGASVTADWDMNAGWGTDRITHPRRLR
ncbi:MAG: hypothetical protein NTY36_01270 [Deltaproteobacteria bacterium]|nr:hypothetical protein [Deltaproteobacteria bacterium]